MLPALREAACDVSVVLPCLDEAAAVGTCVRDALAHLEPLDLDVEVVVCDNGSRDSSPDMAEAAGARVVHEPRRGYGSALASGIGAARGRYIVMADADGSYDLSTVSLMLGQLDAGADLVMGNRRRGSIARGAMPWLHRYVGSPLTSLMLRLFFGRNIGDPHCGLRAFTRDAYRRLALQTTGMEFASEMLARAARLNMTIAEIPVNYHPRSGVSKLRSYRDGWRHLRFLLMYSPTWLYMVPSAILAVVGLTLLTVLAMGTFELFGRQWDMHLSAIASMLTVLATQIAWLGISARTLAAVHGFDPPDPFLVGFYRHFNLEKGLLMALAVFATGGALTANVVWSWASSGFPSLDAIRPLLLAVTLIIVGVQCVFNAFFLSLLGVETRAVEPR
ncbi:MAG: glycosyltransferase family 2 protein [Chloroflexi bacterium]|nr:glycosyltransferase family 2 protein [Chloroflexota bacterium]